YQWLSADESMEFGKRDHRTGKGDRADAHTDVDLDAVNHRFGPNEVILWIEQRCESDKHRRRTDEAVEQRDELRHLSHFHSAREHPTDQRSGNQREREHSVSSKP